MTPAIDDRLIDPKSASLALNAWLYSGSAKGIVAPKVLHTCALSGTGMVYRIPASYARSAYLFNSTWMEFADPDTDVVRAPVFDDSFDRYYWASSSIPPKYNTLARIQSASGAFLLGVPAPAIAPTCTIVGGSSPVVTRSYVYTWVSAYGEEGAPSPPLVKTGAPDGSWNLTLTAAAAGDLGTDRNLTKVNIYRTIVSDTGVATFFFVVQQAIATTTYSDVSTDAVVAANDQLASTTWTEPPSDLAGIVMMPNGIAAGWRNNEVWFSEPYRPHAWPAAYALTLEYPVIGLGVIGQTLVACTGSAPYTISGVTPSAMTESKLPAVEPCLSRGSIVSAPVGVYYASLNGLILVSPGNVQNITKDLISKDRWQTLTLSSPLRGAMLGTAYYAFGVSRPGVFDVGYETTAFAQQDYSGAYSGILIDPQNTNFGFVLLDSEDPTTNIQNDDWSGELFVIRDNNVNWLDQGDLMLGPEEFTWRSKIFQLPFKQNLGAAVVYFDLPQGPALTDFGVVKTYADGRLVHTHSITASGRIYRLPSGYKADFWQFQFETALTITSFQAASSMTALRTVPTNAYSETFTNVP